MNLTPEQRAAGRRNFDDVTRRDFLKGGIAAGAGAGGSLGAFYFGYGASVAEPVRVGVVGTGDEGSVLLGAVNPEFVQVRSIADVRPYNQHRAFHGDIYSDAALEARPGLMTKYGWKTEQEARKHVAVYNDSRELIEKAQEDGGEAIIIALPLHLHAPAAIAAMKAGLHVLTEKLMAKTVHECKEMARVSEQTGLHLATGHQRHYNILYQNAVDTIRRGVLGELHYIRAQWHRGNLPGTDSWQLPLPKSVKPKDPQAERLAKELADWKKQLDQARGRDIDLWRKKIAQKEAQIRDEIVKAESYGYEPVSVKDNAGKTLYQGPALEELIRWRLWSRTGGGLMVELGSHQLDAASIFVAAMHDGKKQHPLSGAASASRPLFPPDRDVEDHVFCMFEFPSPGYKANDPIDSRRKIGVQYASINGNGFGGYGEIVYGTKGTLILEREQEVMLYQEESASTVKAGSGGGPTLDTQASGASQKAAAVGTAAKVSRGYAEEIEHWAWCIRNPAKENKPRCHPEVAMGDAIIALTTNMAAREGSRVDFKEEWFDINSDATPENVKPDLSRYA